MWVIIGHIVSQTFFNWGNYTEFMSAILQRDYKFGVQININILKIATFKLVLSLNFEKAVLAAGVAVDTFFLIGGLLTAYLGTSGWKKAVDSGPLNIVKAYFLFILNRYARLTPVLAFGIWAMVSFVPIFGNGPLCDIATSFNVYCYENWWIALLYGGSFKDRFYNELLILPAKIYEILLTI